MSDLDLFLAGIRSDFFLKETLPLLITWVVLTVMILIRSDS